MGNVRDSITILSPILSPRLLQEDAEWQFSLLEIITCMLKWQDGYLGTGI